MFLPDFARRKNVVLIRKCCDKAKITSISKQKNNRIWWAQGKELFWELSYFLEWEDLSIQMKSECFWEFQWVQIRRIQMNSYVNTYVQEWWRSISLSRLPVVRTDWRTTSPWCSGQWDVAFSMPTLLNYVCLPRIIRWIFFFLVYISHGYRKCWSNWFGIKIRDCIWLPRYRRIVDSRHIRWLWRCPAKCSPISI